MEWEKVLEERKMRNYINSMPRPPLSWSERDRGEREECHEEKNGKDLDDHWDIWFWALHVTRY